MMYVSPSWPGNTSKATGQWPANTRNRVTMTCVVREHTRALTESRAASASGLLKRCRTGVRSGPPDLIAWSRTRQGSCRLAGQTTAISQASTSGEKILPEKKKRDRWGDADMSAFSVGPSVNNTLYNGTGMQQTNKVDREHMAGPCFQRHGRTVQLVFLV